MRYNIYFNIAAIANVFIVLFAYLIHKKVPDNKNKMFIYLCCSTLGSAIVDIISALELSGIIKVSNSVLLGINLFYFVCVCCIPLFFSLYALAISEKFSLLHTPLWRFLFFFPAVLEFSFIIITPGFQFIFSISDIGEYERQIGVIIMYVLMIYQIALGIFVIFHFKENTSVHTKIYLLVFVILTLAGVFFQFIHEYFLVQHFAVSLSLLLIFSSLQLSEIVIHPVTGLLNMKSFTILMNANFKKHQRFSIVSVHLDDIKFVNETFGIEAANNFLIQISEYLKSLTSQRTVFHLDNDVFAIFVPDVIPRDNSVITASIIKRFKKPWKSHLVEMTVSVRQCLIRCPQDVKSTEEILNMIGSVESDKRYKNEQLLFSDQIDVNTRKRYAYIEKLVKTALEENRIFVWYQPLFSPVENKIVGAEALVRMTDKEGKIISPAEFVPIAEQDGTILRIGLYVYEEVCKFIATKKLQNYGIKMIDVNLSVAQCMQNRIAEEFKDILESYSLDPKQVVLEITETANAHTPELLYSNMQKLHEIGFPCSLDDYGTGNANIEYILHMPFSMIKIDKEIVHTAMKDEKAYVMLVGIMDMIHSLNMKSVAEGIETQEMVDKLSSLKCDYLQGFYYSRPIPEDQFMKLIESQKIQEEKTILEEFNHMTQSKADDNVELLEPFEELESVDD